MSDESGYKQARGILGWQPGDEPAEVSIGRLRDNLEALQAYHTHSGVLSQPVSPPQDSTPPTLPTDVLIAQVFERLRTLERVVAQLRARLDERDGDGK